MLKTILLLTSLTLVACSADVTSFFTVTPPTATRTVEPSATRLVASPISAPIATATFAPTPTVALAITPAPDLKKIVGTYVTFEYPPNWSPAKRDPFGGSILETWELGIPNVESDQTLGFSSVALQNLIPNDVTLSSSFVIGGKNGVKWIRAGQGYVSYDYYTVGYQNRGSFGLHVTVAKGDTNLEKQLDRLMQSIIFRN